MTRNRGIGNETPDDRSQVVIKQEVVGGRHVWVARDEEGHLLDMSETRGVLERDVEADVVHVPHRRRSSGDRDEHLP